MPELQRRQGFYLILFIVLKSLGGVESDPGFKEPKFPLGLQEIQDEFPPVHPEGNLAWGLPGISRFIGGVPPHPNPASISQVPQILLCGEVPSIQGPAPFFMKKLHEGPGHPYSTPERNPGSIKNLPR